MCENTLITRHCLLQRKSLSGCEFDNKLLFLVRKKQFSTCLIFVAEIPVKIYRQRLFLNLFLYSYDFYSKTMELIFASQNTARCFKQSLLLKILVLVDFEYFMGPNSKAIIRETTCTKRLHSSNCINVFCYVCFGLGSRHYYFTLSVQTLAEICKTSCQCLFVQHSFARPKIAYPFKPTP